MLILSRKSGESIVIDGRIHVKVVRVEGETVKIGIEAPAGSAGASPGSLRGNPAQQPAGADPPERGTAETAAARASETETENRESLMTSEENILAARPAATDSGTIRPAGRGVPDHAPRTGPGVFQ